MLIRQRMSIQQLREEAAVPPSRYGSDAPPAYDDVINKPEDYPIYHAQGEGQFFVLHLIFSSVFSINLFHVFSEGNV